MKNPPAFQFYPESFIGGTSEMTAEQVGMYIRLLCYQWHKGGLPDDDKKLRIICGGSKKSLKEVLKKFEKDDNGLLKNSRLEKTRTEQTEYRSQQSEKAKLRWAKKDATALPTHMPSGMPNESQTDALYSLPLPLDKNIAVPIAEAAAENLLKLTSGQQIEMGAMACSTTLEAFRAYMLDKAKVLVYSGYCEKYGLNSAVKTLRTDFDKYRKDYEFKTKPKRDGDDW